MTKTPELPRFLRVTMPNGWRYDVPVMVIARHRAASYAKHEYGGDIDEYLRDDTLPLFAEDPYEIKDWATISMDWWDVEEHAVRVPEETAEPDFEDGWMSGYKELIE